MNITMHGEQNVKLIKFVIIFSSPFDIQVPEAQEAGSMITIEFGNGVKPGRVFEIRVLGRLQSRTQRQ
jgi:hypothetical protein